jgi:hypothetical protein
MVEFEVGGKNFPDAKLLADGGGLKKEIDKCADVLFWHFEWAPDDDKYQWYARGDLSLKQIPCLGEAVLRAGGASIGNCA